MTLSIEWATGIGEATVSPGQWVDAYGSRNTGVALWCGESVIVEFGSQAEAARALRQMADVIEQAIDDAARGRCGHCGAAIVLVPESMGDEPSLWVHDDEIGAETPDYCPAVPGMPEIVPLREDATVEVTIDEAIQYGARVPLAEIEQVAGRRLGPGVSLQDLLNDDQVRSGFSETVERHGEGQGASWTGRISQPDDEREAGA